MPTTPQKEAGCLIDPPVSVPKEKHVPEAAIIPADPPEEPPGVSGLEKSFVHGLITLPKLHVSLAEPIANSSIVVLHKTIAPASLRFFVTVDS